MKTLFFILLVSSPVLLGQVRANPKLKATPASKVKEIQAARTEVIQEAAMVVAAPADEKSRKKFNETASEDFVHYIEKAYEFAKKKNLKIVETQKAFLEFKKGDGTVHKITNKAKMTTVYYFDGKKDPMPIKEIIDYDVDYEKYFGNAKSPDSTKTIEVVED